MNLNDLDVRKLNQLPDDGVGRENQFPGQAAVEFGTLFLSKLGKR